MIYAQITTSSHNNLGRRMLPFLQKSLCISAIALCVGVGFSSAAQAESPMVERAEDLIWDKTGSGDPASGRSMLEEAVLAGDAEAKRVLGGHLIYGWVFEKDPVRGLELLKAAAEAGDMLAKTKLGEVLLTGSAGSYDPVKAQSYFQAASSQNEPEAMRLLGEQLILGTHFDKDVPAGLALMERAVAMRSSKAMVSLGEMYLQADTLGRDRAKALELFEAAATLGDGNGLATYGADMMWREISAKDAEAMLVRAGELGSVKAYAALAQGAMYGYLGGGSSSRAKYEGYAGKALNAEAGEVAIFEAERKLWGIGGRASGPEALAILREAADQGNKKAAKYLIGLLRNGNNLNVRRSPSQAQTALEKYAPLLNATEQAQLALTLEAAKARTPQAYADVYRAFEEQPGLYTEAFGRDVYKSNPNVAVYILQAKLKAQGSYSGALDGYATRKALASIYDACKATLNLDLCEDSVMRADVIGALLVHK